MADVADAEVELDFHDRAGGRRRKQAQPRQGTVEHRLGGDWRCQLACQQGNGHAEAETAAARPRPALPLQLAVVDCCIVRRHCSPKPCRSQPPNLLVLLWQVSQGADVVGCPLLGLPMAKTPLWQVAQPLTMPVWFILVPANDTVLRWQFSQGSEVGMWFAGFASALVLPCWELAPRSLLAVFAIYLPTLGVVVGQVAPGADFVGCCLLGLPMAMAPLWQVAQPLTMPVWFILVPANDTVLRWQFSQGSVVGMWAAGLASATVLPLWQVAQPLVRSEGRMVGLACGAAGAWNRSRRAEVA